MIAILLSQAAFAGATVGSYGRVQASADARGGEAQPVNVVSYGTRLEKASYLELDLMLDEGIEAGPQFKVVVTPALQGNLFHYEGEWDASLALRNLYVEANEWSNLPLSAWAGSRMYRGEDVHLLDFWPLDSLNTLGAGLRADPTGWTVAVHGGTSRVAADAWQVQYDAVPVAGGVGTEAIEILDRQRMVGSIKGGRLTDTYKVLLYSELHGLPEGTRVNDQRIQQDLPADRGSVVGLQASAYGWANDSFVHLWLKRATGLAAYGDLSVPGGLATDYTVKSAREHLVATAANHEAGPAAVQVGAYLRRFEDADGNQLDVDDRWEANVHVRPAYSPTENVTLAVEAGQQWLRPDGLNPRTETHDLPKVTKLAVLPSIQPERGSFSRPQLRLQYIYSFLNNDARAWYDFADPRHASNHQHFVGVGAEWWLNSAGYQR